MANNMMKKATVVELIDDKISAERYLWAETEDRDQMVQGIIALETFRELLECALPGGSPVYVDYLLEILAHQINEVAFNRAKKTYQQIGYRESALEDLAFRIKFTAGLVDHEGMPIEGEEA